MSPQVSPRYLSERGSRSRRTVIGIVVEGVFALSLLASGFLICALASAIIAAVA